MTLVLQGSMPSKKNRYRYSCHGGYVPRTIGIELAALELQARSQWKRRPLKEAVVSAVFYVKDGASDLDNKLTSAIDILVKAGVVANDSIKRIKCISAKAVIHPGDEFCEVTVEPAGVAA